MGIKGCSDLMWSMTLSFDIMTHLIKTRHHEVKQHNMTRAYPMVVIDANLIGYREPTCMDPARCVDSIASSFSNNSVRVLVYADDPTKRHNTMRDSIRRKCENDRITVKLIEKREKLSSLEHENKAAGHARIANRPTYENIAIAGGSNSVY